MKYSLELDRFNLTYQMGELLTGKIRIISDTQNIGKLSKMLLSLKGKINLQNETQNAKLKGFQSRTPSIELIKTEVELPDAESDGESMYLPVSILLSPTRGAE